METAYIKFNAGIWSEVLKGRYDLTGYKSAARTCTNFIPTRYGQVEKRSGTKHLGYAKNDAKKCVLHPFQFSVNTKFILEFGEYYVRFWSNDIQVEVTPSAWATTTAYILGDAVTNSGTTYVCTEAHTSGTFATDLAAGKWYALTGNILEVETPYAEADLYELQIRAVNDIVYVVHPDYPVGSLTRVNDDDWRYVETSLDFPFVDPDVDTSDVTLTPSALTGSVTLTASSDVFQSTYVGSEIRMEYLIDGSSVNFSDRDIAFPSERDDTYNANDNIVSFSATAASGTYSPDNTSGKTRVYYDPVGSEVRLCYAVTLDWTYSNWATSTSYDVDDLAEESAVVYVCLEAHTSGTFATDLAAGKWQAISDPTDAPNHFSQGVVALKPQVVTGEWSLKTTGNWRGEWLVQKSIDDGTTWSTIRSLSSSNDSNYLIEEDQDGEEAQFRVLGASYNDGGTQSETVTFTILSTSEYGRAEVTAYTSATEVTATVLDDMPKTEPCRSWQESGFSARQGYPRTIALFDNRLVMAGTKKKPQGFFYSGINEYENFLSGTRADSPFFVETLSDDQSAVQWLDAQRELFVGTASVEGILIARKQDEAQSAENLPVVRWNEAMGSAHRPAMAVRDSLMVLQRGRTTVNMLSYSIERDGYTGEEVSLLCPHLLSSGVLQMSHIREPYTGAHVVTEDGTICHMIYEPKLQVTGWCEFATKGGFFESIASLPSSGDEDELWCVVKRTVDGNTKRHIERFTVGNTSKQRDSDVDNVWYVDAGVKATGSGLTSVSGLDHLEGETVCALADGIKGEYTVSSGAITLTTAADTVIVGLPVESEFEPFDVESEQSASMRKQLYQTKLMLYNSLGGFVSSDGEDYQELIFHKAGETMDLSAGLQNGYSEVFHESSHSRQKYWRIKHDDPYPFTLQAVVQSFTVSKK